MPIHIKSKDQGFFIGSFLGLAIFKTEITIDTPPAEFPSVQEAEAFLSTWSHRGDCSVVEVIPDV